MRPQLRLRLLAWGVAAEAGEDGRERLGPGCWVKDGGRRGLADDASAGAAAAVDVGVAVELAVGHLRGSFPRVKTSMVE